MATVFPFNQLPNIIPQLQQQVSPLLSDAQSKLINTTAELQNKLLSISPNISCNDPQIQQIRSLLERLNGVIATIDPILSFVPTTVDILKIVSTSAQAASTAALAIPTGPPAVLSQTISAAAEAIDRISNFLETLSTQIELFSPVLTKVSAVGNLADQLLSQVCGDSQRFNGLGQLSQTNLNQGLSLTDLANLYPSTFYREVNVTDEDINQRLQTIQALLEEGQQISTSLKEAPSKILSGTTDPDNNIGVSGDYYINTTSGVIFGPKPSDVSWS